VKKNNPIPLRLSSQKYALEKLAKFKGYVELESLKGGIEVEGVD
jgi:hypothetical protein